MKSAYEKALERLEASVPAYIREVGEFQWKNRKWKVSRNYLAGGYETCSVCGKEDIVDVYEIISTETGEVQDVGNVCIKSITNRKIGYWFKRYKTKLKRLKQNKALIEAIEETLGWVSYKKPRERLIRMLKRLTVRYQNLTQTQLEYFETKFMPHLSEERKNALLRD